MNTKNILLSSFLMGASFLSFANASHLEEGFEVREKAVKEYSAARAKHESAWKKYQTAYEKKSPAWESEKAEWQKERAEWQKKDAEWQKKYNVWKKQDDALTEKLESTTTKLDDKLKEGVGLKKQHTILNEKVESEKKSAFFSRISDAVQSIWNVFLSILPN